MRRRTIFQAWGIVPRTTKIHLKCSKVWQRPAVWQVLMQLHELYAILTCLPVQRPRKLKQA